MGESAAVENIVTQNHGAGFITDEFLSDEECLGQSVGRGLNTIGKVNAEMAAITQKILEFWGVLWGGNDQDIPDSGQHQCGQGIVDHGFIINGEKLFGCDLGERIKSGSGTAGQNDAFHLDHLSFISTASKNDNAAW